MEFSITEKEDLNSGAPPEDFRMLPIYPTKNDLFHKPDFLRPNIVDGAYKDVEHYLDVQFRLMREDFIGPLRAAIAEYRKDVTAGKERFRRRYGGARFYYNVNIFNTCETTDGSGMVICYDCKLFRKQLNERKSALIDTGRFLYGSLILLTKNNFDDIIYSTVIENREHVGIILAHLDPKFVSADFLKDTYVMVESKVFFMPYQYILEVLKRPALVHDFPLKNYIIYAENSGEMPKYLKGWKKMNYKTFKEGCDVRSGTFPSRSTLDLNESQYEAYKTAITREFVIIQGPPGTGKTFIGLKIVETILRNLYLSRNKVTRPPILVVCYTNYALDQFLEGILPVTEKLVRVGSQSKSECLKRFNLNRIGFGNKSPKGSKYKQKLLKKTLISSRRIIKSLNRKRKVYDLTREVSGINFKKFFQNFDSGHCPSALLKWLTTEDNEDNLKLDDPVGGKETQEAHILDDAELRDDSEYNDDEQNVIHEREINLKDFKFKLSVGVFPTVDIKKLKSTILKIEKRMQKDKFKKKDVNFVRKERHKNNLRSHFLKVLEERLQRGDVGYDTNVTVAASDVWGNFNIEQRWALYWKWHREIKEKHTKLLSEHMRRFNEQRKLCQELKQSVQLKVLKNSHVVGMTTCGAARRHSLLRSLKSPIVIVEEAAEVLETHVVVTLTSACEHVIMIGDHQQLRPMTASYQLSKHYNLDISLFERMVRNGNHCVQLTTQHRMRPEISKLITPSIYPVLIDHPSVAEYPNIIGVKKNLFFVHHTVKETKVRDSTSRRNKHEADFALNLAKYFVQQGYDPSEITVLAMYAGQKFYMREQQKNISLLDNVLITGLDSYQGKENKIIILSLVRSNSDENIGFLSAVNRVCVALSRAKQGFYIIGNMDILKAKAGLWNDVYNVLQAQDSIGEYLELQCQIHQSVITPVKHADDFMKVAEGGCQTICNRLMNCGHYCKKFCHITDMEHENTRCMEKCERICDLNHKCEDLCYKECRCMVEVERELPCGHTHKLPCSQDYKEMQCNILLEDNLLCSKDHNDKKCDSLQ